MPVKDSDELELAKLRLNFLRTGLDERFSINKSVRQYELGPRLIVPN